MLAADAVDTLGLERALQFEQWWESQPGEPNQDELFRIRDALAEGQTLTAVPACDLEAAVEDILAVSGPRDLPVNPALMRLAVDAMGFRHGISSRRRAWALIGVSDTHGRSYVNGAHQSWPLWYTLREHALGRAEPDGELVERPRPAATAR